MKINTLLKVKLTSLKINFEIKKFKNKKKVQPTSNMCSGRERVHQPAGAGLRDGQLGHGHGEGGDRGGC